MLPRNLLLLLAFTELGLIGQGVDTPASAAAPLVIGDTFTIESTVLGETRRINVYQPPGYAESPAARVPVLYMPDGGMGEDFLHMAGLVQVGAGNGTMRPFLLVGIENTQRRRDLTPPTESASDRKIAKVVGGAAAFRRFMREELMPLVQARYRTTGETAIVGESLAGLFVIDTLATEPDLFDTYIALDASLWWNDGKYLAGLPAALVGRSGKAKALWFASADADHGNGREATQLAAQLQAAAPASLYWHYEPLLSEHHSTIYHPAALLAFRALFAPPSAK